MPSSTLTAPVSRRSSAVFAPPLPLTADTDRIAAEIGPRQPGAVYQNDDGRFVVLSLVTDPAKASAMLHRRAAFALVIRDTLRPDGQPFVIGSAWTCSDYLVVLAGRGTR